MTHARLPIHREYDRALDELADVSAALDRAGCHNPLADAVERIDRARARYATRPGSTPGGAQGAVSPAESHAQPPVDPGAGDPIGGTVLTARSGPEDPEAGLWTGGFVPDAEKVVVGQDNGGCVIPRLATDTADREG